MSHVSRRQPEQGCLAEVRACEATNAPDQPLSIAGQAVLVSQRTGIPVCQPHTLCAALMSDLCILEEVQACGPASQSTHLLSVLLKRPHGRAQRIFLSSIKAGTSPWHYRGPGCQRRQPNHVPIWVHTPAVASRCMAFSSRDSAWPMLELWHHLASLPDRIEGCEIRSTIHCRSA